MSLPASGWFPDPRDGSRLRWGDGATWGSATRPVPGLEQQRIAPAAQVAAPAGPAFSVQPRTGAVDVHAWAYGSTTRRFCLFSCLAVVFAVASVIENPWGIASALGLLLGIGGVVRPRGTGAWRVLGRSVSVSAIVLAVATGTVVLNDLLHLF